jgi:hypothetical protein
LLPAVGSIARNRRSAAKMRHLQLWQPENRQAFAVLNIHSFLQRDA